MVSQAIVTLLPITIVSNLYIFSITEKGPTSLDLNSAHSAIIAVG